MKEYIERDKLYDIESLLMTDIVKENPVANNILEQVLFDIKEVPAADVKEIVHAKWIDTHPNYHNGYHRNTHKCSNCNDYYTTEYEDLFFCPRCGAKMDLK